MPNIFRLQFMTAICLLFILNETNAAVETVTTSNAKSVFELNSKDIINMNKSGLEQQLGRKLTFKEKVVLKFVKNKLRNNTDMSGVDALEQVKTDGLAIAGFVCAISGLIFFGFILGTLGIIFSAIALNRIKREPATLKGRGLAIAGLVIGIVAVLGWLLILMIALGSA